MPVKLLDVTPALPGTARQGRCAPGDLLTCTCRCAAKRMRKCSKSSVARRVLLPTKQSPRQLLILLTLFSLLFSACTAQLTVTPLPRITQESLPVNSSVQIVTSTPTPTDSFIGNAVPRTL